MNGCVMCSFDLENEWNYCPYCGCSVKQKKKTFIEVYEEWEERYKVKISHSTLNCYRAANKYYSPLYERSFGQIDLSDLQRCVDECGKGKRTRENMKTLGNLLYKYALPRHMSDMNYAEYLDTGKNDKKGASAFGPDQIGIIRSGIGKVPFAEVIYVLIYTGFRPAELFELRKESVQTIEGVRCLIGGMKTDAGRKRVITISPQIANIIEERFQSREWWLFPNAKGGKMSTKEFRTKCFYPALEAMGIQKRPEQGCRPRFTPYSCRHTFSNLLKYAAGSDRDKADLMGHTDYQTTKRIYQTAEILAKKAITDQI